jgi:two-component system repressor protein LuxO
MNKSVLIIEDSLPMSMAYKEFLSPDGYSIHSVETLRDANIALIHHQPDIILLDLQLPDGNGLDFLTEFSKSPHNSIVVVMSAHGSVESAVTALKVGADDFLEKPFTADRLRTTITNSLEKKRLINLVRNYEEKSDRGEFHGFIGSSLAMQGIYHMVESAAPSKASVFITGESGTGKEVLAQAIHSCSPRADQPFIALNCAAIPSELMESEIFGHIKGAFTGAAKDRQGAAQLADGGTLFLDEVCEMNQELQAKLLRFLQTEIYRPVGSDQERKVDVRIICATNKNPLEQVNTGAFREDLYYRLHVIPIDLPPLRERGQDIMALSEHFLKKYAAEENKQFTNISTAAQKVLLSYAWPGNIRQMQNVFRLVVVLNDNDTLDVAHLPAELTQASATAPVTLRSDADEGEHSAITPTPAASDESIVPLWQVEQAHIERAIRFCDDNIPKAAALLEISPSTLYRRIKSHPQGKSD